MQHHFIMLKKQHIFFILLYIGLFSLLLTGIRFLCCQPECTIADTNTTADNIQKLLTDNQAATTTATLQDASLKKESPQEIQQQIARNIIRLHVIANSDTDTDQRLKLTVRDKIITSLQSSLRDAESPTRAAEIIKTKLPEIEQTARQTLSQYGSSYCVHVMLAPRYFPIKQYGDLTFPAGIYQALCVEIGKAEGRNWWCVLFPSLCFVNETTATIPDSSKEKLKERLSEEEYQSISESGASSNLNNSTKPEVSAAPEKEISEAADRPELRLGILDWLRSQMPTTP